MSRVMTNAAWCFPARTSTHCNGSFETAALLNLLLRYSHLFSLLHQRGPGQAAAIFRCTETYRTNVTCESPGGYANNGEFVVE